MKSLHSVMLIDDDPVFNVIHEKTLRQVHFAAKIKAHSSAEEALEDLKKQVSENAEGFPEVIFLDISMPGVDGWEFIEEFKKLPKESLSKCRIFILSSSIDYRDIEKSKTFEVVHEFITKPLTAEKLLMLGEIIENSSVN